MANTHTDVVEPILTFGTNNFPLPDYCCFCANFNATNRNCSAFPNGIPTVIYFGEFDHRKPFKGDNGVRFEANPDYDEAENLVEVSLEWRVKNPRNGVAKNVADTQQSTNDTQTPKGSKLIAAVFKALRRGKEN